MSCQDCLFSWEGYAHGFTRGHSVLTKGDRILFIPDDIWYSFPIGTDFDIEVLFSDLGWRPLESCPKCNSKKIFPPVYDENTAETIECQTINCENFEKVNSDWKLTEVSKMNFA